MKREELLGWINSLIINSAELGEPSDAKNWGYEEGILISRAEAEEIRTHLSLPPAEGAEEMVMDGFVMSIPEAEIQWAGYGPLGNIKQQPTAEGAEVDVLFKARRFDTGDWVTGFFTKKKIGNLICPVIEVYKEWDSGDYIESYEIDGKTLVSLHAQRIADKMVSERDDDIFDKMNCLIGYLERWLNNPQSNNPPAELRSVIDEAIEYIKTREDK